jgi:hypothetical protein
VRQLLSSGLYSLLKDGGSEYCETVLAIVKNMNKLKRGGADVELDYDVVIKTIDELVKK